ncbi:hypothetical protein HWV62_1408 [Athelia sp. TMB]|nr:hypothetical protein HWV62_1408 [Athelia sp. TMB]
MRGSHSRLPSVTRLSKAGTLCYQGRRMRAERIFTNDLAKGTKDPVWMLMEPLRKLKYEPKVLGHALQKNGVTLRDFQMYSEVIQARDIDHAIAVIREMAPYPLSVEGPAEYFTHEVDTQDIDTIRNRRLPTWVVLFLVSHKARTPAQAERSLLDLVFNQIPYVSPKTQPSLLVLTALALAKYSLVTPMQRVLDVFLTIPIEHSRLHFNLLLQAIARLPKSPEAAKLAVKVLEIMTSRAIMLAPRTYHILLADRFVTLELTKILRTKMLEQGFLSSAAHLESYVRVFSKSGDIHDANKYMEAIRAHEARRGSPHIPISPNPNDTDGSPHRANTKYMRVFGEDRSSAFNYLARLLGQQAVRPPQANETKTLIPQRNHLPAKKTVDVFDWTTALSAAARDLSLPSKRLLDIFNRTLDSTTFPPTVATYTVLLRGLIRRKSYTSAALIWDRLIKDRLVLDRKTIGAGVKALTLAGDPTGALRVLEAFGAKPGAVAASPALVRRGPRLWKRMNAEMRPEVPVQLDTMTMNDFMVALLRIERPDVVVMIWDHMEKLYNVKPDSHSLDTLCRAARLAVKLDSGTFKGNIAMLGLSNPFRRPKVAPSTRDEVVQAIQATLAGRDRGNVRSIWKGKPAVDIVRAAFRGLIVSNWPYMRYLRAPAHAVRRPGEEDGPFAPLREVAQSISQSISNEIREETWAAPPTPPLLSISSLPPHASVVPSDATFQAYILLLGTSSYQHEVPLTLAWMRALQVKPSHRTLCFALIFWAEVSLRGPLFEDWADRNDRSEYGRLVKWMKEWVGEKRVPTDDMVAAYLKEVDDAKDTRRPRRKPLTIRPDNDDS